MEGERETYRKHGTEDELIEIDAQEVLDAIAKGQDIDIRYADIQGNLDIDVIYEKLEQTEDGDWIIKGNINILRSTIRGVMDFSGTTFNSSVVFSGATFSNLVAFCGTTFNAGLDFSEATFNMLLDFSGTTFSKFLSCSIAVMACPAYCPGVSFTENTVGKRLKDYIARPLIWLVTMGKVKLEKRPITDFLTVNTATMIDSPSNPYLKRYIDDEQWIASWRERSRWRGFLFYIWEITSHCGRSFSLWMLWALLAAVIFGAVYADYTVPSWMPGPIKSLLVSMDPKVMLSTEGRIPTGFTPYYFSIVTFTTLGFGDIEPQGLAGEIWLALEVVLGYVMLGGLISIFANKFARRS